MQIPFNDFKTEYVQHKQTFDRSFARVMKNGWYILGPEVEKFETAFAAYIGSKYAIGVANGLEALQISLMALEIGPGDEVITTPISAVATTLAILAVGAKPIFVDVDGLALLDINKIEAAITPKTKAVLPVHLYGTMVDPSKLQSLCRRHRLHLVEDAAQAHGARYRGKRAGSFGTLAAFSFYPTKNLGAIGDGGAITTSNRRLAERCQMIRNYGQKSKYIHTVYGLNSRLDELQAALLSQKLKNLEKQNRQRRKIATAYQRQLAKIPGLTLLLPNELANSAVHLCVLKTKQRDALQRYLTTQSIASLVHYPKIIPDQPLFEKKYARLELPRARKMVQEILSLPCYPTLTLSQVNYISTTIKKFFQN